MSHNWVHWLNHSLFEKWVVEWNKQIDIAIINFKFLFYGTHSNRLSTVKSLKKGFMIRTALGSGRKVGGEAKHLIDGSEEHICQLSFKLWSPHVIERRRKIENN